jgi:hypothetical protein
VVEAGGTKGLDRPKVGSTRYLTGGLRAQTGMDNSPVPSSYRDLLEAARSLGRADGLFAARFEDTDADADCPVCQGRSPEDFARFLWGEQPGTPPSGLEVNAPLWYAQGLAEARRRTADHRRDAFAWILLRSTAIPRDKG